MRTWLVVGAIALTGCIEPNLRLCDDNETACPVDTVCLASGGCGSLEDVAACEGHTDGEACTSGFGAGRCHGGACRAAVCGNGEIESGEVCDDGNLENGDGCNGVCTSDETCGNGISELLEACDCGDTDHPGGALCAGTVNGGDICRDDCTLVRCGNGQLDALEVCDDGNVESGDGCNSACTSNESCGNGIRDVNEQCDDGNLDAGDACQPTCLIPRCGDSYVDPDEVCDDGDLDSGDGCNGTCTSDETCGNGLLDINEQCDDGNVDSGDSCQETCTLPRCGDDFLDPGEVCDDGNNTPGDGCSFDCKSDETCGNEIIDFFAGEQCDDNRNGLLHDGCTDTCKQEPVMWIEASQARAPLARLGHAMVYDSHRNTLFMHGGMAGNLLLSSYTNSVGTFGDSWEWDPIALHWVEHVGAGPGPRFGHAMAYDAARKRVVLFGGYERLSQNVYASRNDTWEWDSLATTWIQVTPTTSPPARGLHAMAYDSKRGRVVMFGGGTENFGSAYCGNMPTATFTDTWEWTGTNWIDRTPTGTSPTPRVSGGMVWDSARELIVLTPGYRADTDGSEKVWEWNGAPTNGVWTQRTVSSPTYYGRATAYDPVRARVVAYGGENFYTSGCGIDTASDVTSTWNGATDTWTSSTTTPNPGERSFTAGAFATIVGATVLFAGQNSQAGSSALQTLFSDVWNWNGSTWAKQGPAAPPSVRGAKVAFDAGRQQLVMYGGVRGTGSNEVTSSETWVWDGYAWSQRFPASSPGPRTGHAMAYDPKRERVVLYGGGNSSYGSISANNETWEWDGTNWEKRIVSAPSSRAGHEMVWDQERQTIVMFGGSQYLTTNGLYPPYPDTWTYDGTSWSLASNTGPSARVQFAMTFDTRRRTVVLHGGTTAIESSGYRTDVGDTWEWNGAWTLRSTTGPGERDQHAMADDPLNLGVVLFGGQVEGALSADHSHELWQWNGETGVWTLVEMFGPPAGRFGHVGVYDGTRHELVFAFGAGTLDELDDTWTLPTALVGSSAPVDDNCSGASDLDQDGRLGCDDPDCWTYCTPACPPLTNCPGASVSPRCGDGACSQPRENSLRCPADCP